MNVLVLGSGGREHALAVRLGSDSSVDRLWCAPGNPGIATEQRLPDLAPTDLDAVVAACRRLRIDLVVPGPEAPLAAGVADRIERFRGDIVVASVEPADAVLAHRVVCCYPDWEPFVDALTGASRGVVALTLPVDRWWTRVGFAASNRGLAFLRRRFRLFVHPVAAVLGRAASAGFQPMVDRSGLLWRTLLLVREPAV